MGEGYYQATSPYIRYDDTYVNHVPDGNAETEEMWFPVGSPTRNQRGFTRFNGLSSRWVAGNANSGTESTPFDLEPGKRYTFMARVFIRQGGVQAQLPGVVEFDSALIATTPKFQWLTLRQDFVIPITSPSTLDDIAVQFIATEANTEFFVDAVAISEGGLWQSQHSPIYSDTTVMLSKTNGASATFDFTGTGFEIGLITNRQAGEVEICYGPTGDTPDNCFIYQQEDPRQYTTSSRMVTGLPSDDYTVVIREVDDGNTVTRIGIADQPRPPFLGIAQMAVDYVRIYDDALPPALDGGFYNEDATDASGEPYLKLYPEDRWTTISGRAAVRYTQESYVTISDNFNRRNNLYAGPTALLNVNVPLSGGATIVLQTGPASFANTQQLMVCAGNERSGGVVWDGRDFSIDDTNNNCVLKTTLNTDTQVVVGPDELAALGQPGTHVVTFTPLKPGFLDVDSFQIISGTALSAGIHDDLLPDNLLNFETSGSDRDRKSVV